MSGKLKNNFWISYLDLFLEFAAFTEFYKTEIVLFMYLLLR